MTFVENLHSCFREVDINEEKRLSVALCLASFSILYSKMHRSISSKGILGELGEYVASLTKSNSVKLINKQL